MAQILDPLPSNVSNSIVCCYVNATSHIQIARICNVRNWYFERVVFPGQRLVFEATLEALLEIHTGKMASSILSDKIPCGRLEIGEGQKTKRTAKSEDKPAIGLQLPRLPRLREVSETFTVPALSTVD